MSRAMNLTLAEEKVRAMCLEQDVTISAIEVLPSGGTHLVCTTSDESDRMRRKFGKHVIEGPVRRFAFYRARGNW